MAAPSTGDDYARCLPLNDGIVTPICAVHGGVFSFVSYDCQTVKVLRDVRAERARQFAKYGTNERLDDGTGPEVRWLSLYLNPAADDAGEIQTALRSDYELYEELHGDPTWMHMVREEVAEAFAETEPARLRAELIQVAALCVSWAEKIDARGAAS